MQQFPGSKLLVSAVEHESILKPAQRYDTTEIPVDAFGTIDLDKLTSMIDDKTVLVSVMAANNEVGTIQPLREVAKILQLVRAERLKSNNTLPLYLHSDACQAGNYLDLHVSRLGVDLMTLNGGKIYGPKQSGALYIASHVRLLPLILGGGQERGMRSGTENVAAIMGFATALEQAQASRHEEAERLKKLQTMFFTELETAVPSMVIHGSQKHRLPNNVHITIPGQDNERLIMALDEAGIQAAAGSACSASNDEPSHVLKAIGLSDAEAQSSLRFTLGRLTAENDIRQTVQALAKLVA
jgi:cysteine desulfurase